MDKILINDKINTYIYHEYFSSSKYGIIGNPKHKGPRIWASDQMGSRPNMSKDETMTSTSQPIIFCPVEALDK